MNALEFTATTHDGVVEIPPQYLSQWNKKQVRVILLEAEAQPSQSQPVAAELANANEVTPLPRKAGALKGRITIAPDFNAPLEEFIEPRVLNETSNAIPGFGMLKSPLPSVPADFDPAVLFHPQQSS